MHEVVINDYMEIDALKDKAKLSCFIFNLRRVGERINLVVCGSKATNYLKKSMYFNPSNSSSIYFENCEFCGKWKSGDLFKDKFLEENKAIFVLEDCYQKIRVVELTIKNLS